MRDPVSVAVVPLLSSCRAPSSQTLRDRTRWRIPRAQSFAAMVLDWLFAARLVCTATSCPAVHGDQPDLLGLSSSASVHSPPRLFDDHRSVLPASRSGPTRATHDFDSGSPLLFVVHLVFCFEFLQPCRRRLVRSELAHRLRRRSRRGDGKRLPHTRCTPLGQ